MDWCKVLDERYDTFRCNGYALRISSDMVIGRARKTTTQKLFYNGFNLFTIMLQEIRSETNIRIFLTLSCYFVKDTIF